ncbi:MAG: hypothetical protein ACOCP8_00045 [archaeon]
MRKSWKKKENKELLKYIQKLVDEGVSITKACNKYANLHGLKGSQVKSHYYQIHEEGLNIGTEYKIWTEEENNKLLEKVEKEKTKTKKQIFKEYAMETNRNPKAVHSQYYFLLNKKVHNYNKLKKQLEKLSLEEFKLLIGNTVPLKIYEETKNDLENTTKMLNKLVQENKKNKDILKKQQQELQKYKQMLKEKTSQLV